MSEFRIYIIFRADLPEMTRAKGEVQAAHAVASLIYKGVTAGEQSYDRVAEYMGHRIGEIVTSGQMKVCMEVDAEKDFMPILHKARERGVTCVVICDEGRTVFKEPTCACIAIGPCSKTDGNAITRGVRMRT